jgi:predicted Zn-dependent protease
MTPRFALAAPLLAFTVLSAGCAANKLERLDRPSVAPQDAWEADAIRRATEAEQQLQASGAFVDDAAMQSYLDDVLRRLLHAAGADGVPMRVRVLRAPLLNAVSFVNGLVVIDVSYLSVLENGAQLAVILGHEVEHHLGRHALRSERDLKNRRAMSLIAMTPLLAVGMVELSFMIADDISDALTTSYSHGQEREADAAGLAAALKAGYDVRESVAPFEALIGLYAEEGIVELPKQRTHPPLWERLATRREQLALLRPIGGSWDTLTKDERYVLAVAPALVVAAENFVELHRLARARRAIDRALSARPDDAHAWYVKGGILRRTAGAQPSRLSAVAEAFARATELDPKKAQPWRELGLVRRIQGNDAHARAAFARYLALAPAASDRAVVESWLAE